MKIGLGAILGALLMFFGFKQCEQPQEISIITKKVSVPTYIEKVTSVKVPVTKIKYIRLYDTTTTYVHDTTNQLVEVTTYDTTKSLAVIPYNDSLVNIQDSITLTGTILDFKRKVTVKERQPDTLTITKETIKYFRGIKYYVGADSDLNNLFQPSFGLSYDGRKFQVSLGYRPTTKIVEARFFLPLIKF
jgi:hypothetical protein